MKITRLLFFVCLLSQTLYAQQSKYTLSGSISDSENQQKLAYVTIIASDTNGVFVNGAATSDQGTYRLELPGGKFQVQFQFIGYQTLIRSIDLKNNQRLDIELLPDIEVLSTVDITGKRSSVEHQIDRKVINLGEDLQASGGDALEVFQQLPDIQIEAEGNISFRGSTNVNILINGKPSALGPQDLLQQIDASEIQKIELISSPSAKFRANGLTGIINIITQKKADPGWSLNFNGSYNTNAVYRTGVQAGYGNEKLRFNLGTRLADTRNRTFLNRSRTGDGFLYQQEGYSKFDGGILGLKLGLDLFLNPRNELSISANLVDNSHDIINRSQVTEATNSYAFESISPHIHLSNDYNLNYRHLFKKEASYLEIDLQRSDNANDLDASYRFLSQEQRSDLDYQTLIDNLALDYVLPLPKAAILLELGALYTTKKVTNEQQLEGFTATPSESLFTFNEENTALYALAKRKWKKIEAQLGLRLENFQSEAYFQNNEQRFEQRFQNFFPSLHLNYTIKENQKINIAYNRRISRPGLWQVNPFANATDPFFNRAGNPNLRPEFADNIELKWQFSKEKWSFYPGLFYRRKSDLILPFFASSNDDNQILQGYQNLGSSNAYGLEFSWQSPINKIWQINLSGNSYWEVLNDISEMNIGFKRLYRHNWSWRNNLNLSKKLNADVSAHYRSRSRFRFSENIPTFRMDVGLRYKVFDQQGTLSLRISDLLNTYEFQNTFLGEGFEEIARRNPQSQNITLAFNFKLKGKGTLKNRKRKNRSLDKAGALE